MFLVIFAALIIIVFLIVRKRATKEGTWVGAAGMKAKYMWDHGLPEQRNMMLAAIGLWEGSRHNELVSMKWTELPSTICISLSESLKP